MEGGPERNVGVQVWVAGMGGAPFCIFAREDDGVLGAVYGGCFGGES